MDVVTYSRVSTDDQKENGFSLQDQERRLSDYCARHGKEVIARYQEDHSAKDFNRPVFQDFLTDLRAKKIRPTQLVCIRFDRFSRNVLESLSMLNMLKSLGVEVVFVEQNTDLSTPESLLPHLINMALPQIENERRALNTIRGMRQAMRQGKWVHKAPKGYFNDPVEKGIVPNKDASFIQRAFEGVSLGIYSIEEVRTRLRSEGFSCSKQQFQNLLRNPIYKGIIVLKAYREEPEEMIRGTHQPLVSEELFDDVQKVLAARARKGGRRKPVSSRFPLRRHLKCNQCGGNLTASSSQGRSKKYAYYHCQKGCKERFSADIANEAFENLLQERQVPFEVAQLYNEILGDVFSKKEQSQADKIAESARELQNLRRKLANLDERFLEENLELDDYQRISRAQKEKIRIVEQRIEDLQGSSTPWEQHVKFGVTLLTDLPHYYQEAAPEVKDMLIGSIFPEKLVFDGKKYRTARENLFVSLIASGSRTKKSRSKNKVSLSGIKDFLAPQVGLEPTTYGLTVRRSNQLSY
jgi:site-specific DNA recombinase